MHGRGCSKRHTVGCTDDLSASGGQLNGNGGNADAGTSQGSSTNGPASASSGGGGRTRRSGLLTVMERPPG